MDKTNSNNIELHDIEPPELGSEFSSDVNGEQRKPTVFDLNQVGDKQGIPNVADTKTNKAAIKGAAVIFMAGILLFGGFWGYKNFILKRQQDSIASVQNNDAASNTSTKKLEVSPIIPQPLEPVSAPVVQAQAPITVDDHQVQPQPVVSNVEPVATPAPKTLSLAEKKYNSALMGQDASQLSEQTASASVSPYAPNGGEISDASTGSSGKLGGLMKPVQTGAKTASIMKDPNLTLSKGTFIECFSETRLDTTVPGLVSCVIARDVYSENGKVLLIEKGSKAVGEYQSSVEQGMNRIFVLWTAIKTTNGVQIGLDSPSSDALGGAGLSGKVNNHWFKRFGNALLFSVVQDGFSYLTNRNASNSNSGVVYQNTENNMDKIIEEAMRATGNIPPTLTKNQGERIGIMVSRDLYFGDVYALKAK